MRHYPRGRKWFPTARPSLVLFNTGDQLYAIGGSESNRPLLRGAHTATAVPGTTRLDRDDPRKPPAGRTPCLARCPPRSPPRPAAASPSASARSPNPPPSPSTPRPRPSRPPGDR
ncbi:hypothetical protein ACFFX0_11280 [Citricoccus parietis]|uniref:Galactose oxidase-like Early set domain-containing protein n=1 Tax=Citricoccus parietis TaxID=592307 RepID=A0ABV5FYJ1_9MICC